MLYCNNFQIINVFPIFSSNSIYHNNFINNYYQHFIINIFIAINSISQAYYKNINFVVL